MKRTLKQILSLLIVASMLFSLVTVAVAGVTEPTITIKEQVVDAEDGIKKLVFSITTPSGSNAITATGLIFSYDPAKITHYAGELATKFHRFYNAQRVMTDDESVMQARIFLCNCVRNTMKNVLSMLKIQAPESM